MGKIQILAKTLPREMVMATLRWMGVPEAEVRMVEGTYEKTTARVVVGEGASEEFEVNIGLRQGSVLSPLLFIAVLDLISRKTVVKDAIGLYRDVWIAAIASSTMSLATRTAAICVRFQGRRVRRVTSQCRLRSLRENPL